MRILYDQAIPFIDASFAKHGDCIPYKAGGLSQAMVSKADVLLVRSVTPVSRYMLEASSLQAVGSVTAGVDHLALDALSDLHIPWYHSPGANARAVAEYVASVLAYLEIHNHVTEKTMGLIGCGEVGSRVRRLAGDLGWQVTVYDPPKANRESTFESARWENLFTCSVLCCCVPLTKGGDWPTHHMIDAAALQALPTDSIVVNVGRGGVLDEKAFLSQTKVRWCCDVWEGEPLVNPAMVQQALLATPHIAGYSKQAKTNLTWQVYDAMAEQFAWKKVSSNVNMSIACQLTDSAAVLAEYDPSMTSQCMKNAYREADAASFRQLRSDYAFRPEWGGI